MSKPYILSRRATARATRQKGRGMPAEKSPPIHTKARFGTGNISGYWHSAEQLYAAATSLALALGIVATAASLHEFRAQLESGFEHRSRPQPTRVAVISSGNPVRRRP